MPSVAPDTPEWHKMLAGEHYNCFDPALVQGRYQARRNCRKFNDTEGDPHDLGIEGNSKARGEILDNMLGACDPSTVEIEPPFYVDYGTNIFLGKGFYANFGLIILDCNTVKIGERVLCGPNVHIYTAGHPTDVAARVAGDEFAKPITIGDDCWIGGQVVILPGVNIGSGVTVAAASVVHRDVPSNCVVAGTPCRIIKKLKGFIEPTEQEQEQGQKMKVDEKAA